MAPFVLCGPGSAPPESTSWGEPVATSLHKGGNAYARAPAGIPRKGGAPIWNVQHSYLVESHFINRGYTGPVQEGILRATPLLGGLPKVRAHAHNNRVPRFRAKAYLL